jgi:hypothetical protein
MIAKYGHSSTRQADRSRHKLSAQRRGPHNETQRRYCEYPHTEDSCKILRA